MTSTNLHVIEVDGPIKETISISTDEKHATAATPSLPLVITTPSKFPLRKDSMFDVPPSPMESIPINQEDDETLVGVDKSDTKDDDLRGVKIDYIERELDEDDLEEKIIVNGKGLSMLQPQKSHLPATFITLPSELRIRIFKLLTIPELMKAAQTCHAWRTIAYDGTLWQDLDLTPYYQSIPGDQLLAIALAAGGFLRIANFRGCIQLSSHMLRTLSEHCSNVRFLSLKGCRSISPASIACFLGEARLLEILDLSCHESVNNYTLQTIAGSCKQLRVLDVSWCRQVSATGITAVAKGCPALKNLKINGCTNFDTKILQVLGAAAPNLDVLSLASCTLINDAGLAALLPHLSSLRHLNLSNCYRITDDTLRVIAKSCTEITKLELSGCNGLTDDGLIHLSSRVTKLQFLDLEDVILLTDQAVRAFGTYQSYLRHLCLSGCEHVTDDAIRFLARDAACIQSLEHLELDNCSLVTDATLDAWATMVTSREHSSNPTVGAVEKEHESTTSTTYSPQTSTIEVYDCRHITYSGVRNAQQQGAAAGLRIRSFYSWHADDSDDEDNNGAGGGTRRRANAGNGQGQLHGRRLRGAGFVGYRRRRNGSGCTIL